MSDLTNVWICGPFGNMGTALRTAIENTPDIKITGVVSPEHVGSNCPIGENDLPVFDSLEAISNSASLPDVIVDFTFAEVAFEDAIFAAKHNVDFVTGTTGLSQDQKNEIETAFANSESNAIIASNFSVGAVLMMHFAAEAAKHFTHAEIVETHRVEKKDAPSGTAITTRDDMVSNSSMEQSDIPIHSLRLPGALAHQQVHLSSAGEILRIEHDANDRTCFMPGIILSIRNVHAVKGVKYSIEDLLFPAEG